MAVATATRMGKRRHPGIVSRSSQTKPRGMYDTIHSRLALSTSFFFVHFVASAPHATTPVFRARVASPGYSPVAPTTHTAQARHFRWFAPSHTCAHSQTGHPSRMSQWQWHLHEMGSVHLALAWWPGQNTSLTNPPPKTPCMPTPSTSAQHAQLCQRDPPVHHREDGGCNIDATQPHCPGLEQGWLAPVLPRPAVLELRLPAADMGGSAVGQ